MRQFAGLLLVALVCATPTAQEVAPASAPVARVEIVGNQVLVPAGTAERPFRFLLDTGTGDSYLDARTALRLGGKFIDGFNVIGFGPGSTGAARLVRPIEVPLQVVDGEVGQEFARVMDLSQLAKDSGHDVDGILGGDFMRRFVVEIDYADQRLTLHPRKYRPTQLAQQLRMTFSREQFPMVRFGLRLPDGKTVSSRAMVDTGAGATFAGGPFHRRHRLAQRLDATAPRPLGRGAGGLVFGQMARVPAVTLGDLEFVHLILSLPDAATETAFMNRDYDANVGGDILRRFTVTFDYGRSTMHLAPNARINDPFEMGMTGLNLTTAGPPYDRVLVDYVIPDAPAAEAGLLPGDRVLAINGDLVQRMTLAAVRQRFRSPEGTEFAVTIERDGRTRILRFVTRRLI